MIQIHQCGYMPPRIGDVALMSMLWEQDNGYGVQHSVVPVVGNQAWWAWCRLDPPVIQQVFQKMYQEIQLLLATQQENEEPL